MGISSNMPVLYYEHTVATIKGNKMITPCKKERKNERELYSNLRHTSRRRCPPFIHVPWILIGIPPVIDVNECSTGAHRCPANSVCTNTPGGYTCKCKKGYTASGKLCRLGNTISFMKMKSGS